MEWYVNEKPSQAELERIFAAVKVSKKGVKVRKYAGLIKAIDNPVNLQRKLRDEWRSH